MGKPVSVQHMQLASDFAAAFPYPKGQDEIVIANADFDTWADNVGHYTLKAEKATISNNRNALRNKINAVASHEDFLKAKNRPYHVRVYVFGESMVRQEPKESFDFKKDNTPTLIVNKGKAQERNLEVLMEIVKADPKSPPTALLQVDYAIKEIRRCVRVIEQQAKETDAAISNAYAHVAKLAKAGKLGSAAAAMKQITNGMPKPKKK